MTSRRECTGLGQRAPAARGTRRQRRRRAWRAGACRSRCFRGTSPPARAQACRGRRAARLRAASSSESSAPRCRGRGRGPLRARQHACTPQAARGRWAVSGCLQGRRAADACRMWGRPRKGRRRPERTWSSTWPRRASSRAKCGASASSTCRLQPRGGRGGGPRTSSQ